MSNLSVNTHTVIENFQRTLIWYNVFLFLVIIFAIVGNIMVIMAVLKNKNLQSTTNYFLLSLAVADFLVAIIVMPLYVLVETIGYFPFGFLVCNLWTASDICLCTSSIWHMSTISIDRYFTIKFPFKYGRNKSRKFVFLKIAVVWIISLSICSVMFTLALINPRNVYDPVSRVCAPTNATFKIFGSVFAFFIPLTIVVITYSFTMWSLKRLMDKKKMIMMGDDCLKNQSSYSLSDIAARHQRDSRLITYSFIAMKEDISPKENFSSDAKDEEGVEIKPVQMRTIPNNKLTEKKSHNHLRPSISYGMPSRKISRETSVRFSNASTGSRANKGISITGSTTSNNRVDNERKAQKVLIIMFIIFVAAWTPFFLVNTLSAFCDESNFSPSLIMVITWLGYLASLANPIIYTMFNKRFRTAFQRLIFCRTDSKLGIGSFRSSHYNNN